MSGLLPAQRSVGTSGGVGFESAVIAGLPVVIAGAAIALAAVAARASRMTRPTAARISVATTSSAILAGVVLDSDAQGLSLGLVALGIGILLVVVSRG